MNRYREKKEPSFYGDLIVFLVNIEKQHCNDKYEYQTCIFTENISVILVEHMLKLFNDRISSFSIFIMSAFHFR